MFLRISVSSDFTHILNNINEILDVFNFNYSLKCESYKESKSKFPSETWVIGNDKEADITLVVDIKNRDPEQMVDWIITCLDKKM